MTDGLGEKPAGTNATEAPADKGAGNARDIWVPIGVRDNEKPTICPDLQVDTQGREVGNVYDGVRVPFNLFSYLLKADELAIARGDGRFSVMGTGISRLIKKIEDPDRINVVLDGRGEQEDDAYLRRLIELESIREAVVEATVAVLGLDSYAGFMHSTKTMMGDRRNRDLVLQDIAAMRGKLGDVISFYGGETTLRAALRKALPTSKRSQPCPSGTDGDELSYVLTEAALVKRVIANNGGSYMCHVGSDMSPTDQGQKSITECLREAICGTELGHDMAPYWLPMPVLNGAAFYRSTRSSGSSGNAPKAVDPYYLHPEHVRYDEQHPIPMRLPGIPWMQGWVTNQMKDEGGGLAPGQVRNLMIGWVNPVLRRFVRNAEMRGILGRLQSIFHEAGDYESLMNWANQDDKTGLSLMPKTFVIDDVNDAIRTACCDIAEATKRRLTHKK